MSSLNVVASHQRWVRISHAIVTLSFMALLFTGIEMTMVHPRFYWGEVGNDLTPVLFEVPISRNYQHNGFTKPESFFTTPNSPVSAGRTYDIFNQNGWGRSAHFLAGWFMVGAGMLYFLFAILTGHIAKNLIPKKSELSLKLWMDDVRNHLRFNFSKTTAVSKYGLLQKSTYFIVIVVIFPITILTGITMSPALTATFPLLLKLWGAQSARTIHFFCSTILTIFLLVHLIMIIKTGFKRNAKAITLG